MPWPNAVDREEVDTKFKSLKNVKKGQATYLFYKRFLTLWKAAPKYDTIHFIGLLRVRPELDTETWDLLKHLLFKNLTKSEALQSISDAHHQMERKYFDVYEDEKLSANGEVKI